MRAANNWHDYELIDTASGEKLERWKNITLIRPDPQIIWKTGKNNPGWNRADAHYHRSRTGGGHWEYLHKLPESWKVSYGDLTFKISPTGFKHTGLFPEQAVNWDLFMKLIREAGRPVFGPESVRLYRRCHTCLSQCWCNCLPCRRIQGHGPVGKGKRCSLRTC